MSTKIIQPLVAMVKQHRIDTEDKVKNLHVSRLQSDMIVLGATTMKHRTTIERANQSIRRLREELGCTAEQDQVRDDRKCGTAYATPHAAHGKTSKHSNKTHS